MQTHSLFFHTMKFNCFLSFFLSLFFFSCAGVPGRTEQNSSVFVHVTRTKKIALLSPDHFENDINGCRSVTVSYKKKTNISQICVHADKTEISLSIPDSAGPSGVLYKNGMLSGDYSFLPKGLKPEFPIADFQFCFYNAADLAVLLEKSNLRLTVETRDNGLVEIRRIYNYSNCIEEIIKKETSVQIVNYFRKYTVTIQKSVK